MVELESLSSNKGSIFFKTLTTLPLIASPQILSRGNFSLSTNTQEILFLAKNKAALTPAGPAPRIKTCVSKTLIKTQLMLSSKLMLT